MVTPLLFDAAARRAGRPGLRPHLVERMRSELPGRVIEVLSEPVIDQLVLTRPFAKALVQGIVGVPLLTESELMDLTRGAERGAEQAPDGRWWEFWQTEDGEYALFPATDDPALPIAVAAVVVTAATVQLRRFDTGLVLSAGHVELRDSPTIVAETCVHQVDVDEPGAPYTGRCADGGCAGGCTPLILVNPDDGLYRLAGCDCG
jgi:hypothetical protein